MILTDVKIRNALTVKTPTGGRHLYFKSWVRQTVGHLGEGLDTPGMVPCPQSIVPGKKGAYVITHNGKISFLPDFIKDQLIIHSRGSKKKSNFKAKPLVKLDLIANIQRARLYARQEAEPAIEGDGGDAQPYLTTATLKDFGVSRELCFAIMVEEYNPRCQPPWSHHELKKKIKNAYTYGNNPPGINTAEADFNKTSRISMMGPDSLNSTKSSDTKPPPLSLIDKIAPLPYPMEALPTIIRNATEEVLAFIKAPVPLVASSALSTVSLSVSTCRRKTCGYAQWAYQLIFAVNCGFRRKKINLR
jgi:hypothetical protein